MKKIIAVITLMIVLLASGCTKKSYAPQNTANSNETSFQDNENSATEVESTTEAETVADPVRLKICQPLGSYMGECGGWFAYILSNEFNAKAIMYTDMDNYENMDIYVWPMSYYTKNIDGDKLPELLEWTDELLASYSNISEYFADNLNYVAEISNGRKYGIIDVYNPDNEEWHAMSNIVAINANISEEKLKAAMELMDYMADPDGAMTYYYGPKGCNWDINENGEYYLTDFGKTCQEDGTTVIPEEYGGDQYQNGLFMADLNMWSMNAVNPKSATGQTFNLISQ